jgi:hypothetical protein
MTTSVTEIIIDKNKTIVFARNINLFITAISTMFILGCVLWYSRYGIDFTDESFYLVWISNPYLYTASVTQFGFIYHPLYELFDGNIAVLRQANILITFCLAGSLANIFLKTVFESRSLERSYRLTISAAIATTSLIWLRYWLPTPSYDSLALQALMVTAMGFLLANKNISSESIMGWFLIGFGGWLAFMAKPTTAVALGMVSCFYILLAGKLNTRLLMFSLLTFIVLLVFSALIIDGSILGFIDRLKAGAEATQIFNGGYSISQILRFDSFQFSENGKILLVIGSTFIALLLTLSHAQNRVQNRIAVMLSLAMLLFGLAVILGFITKLLNEVRVQGLLVWVIPFGTVLGGVVIYRFKGLSKITLAQWALVFSFLIFPHVYAFGTNSNYWSSGVSASIFWIFAGLVFLASMVPSKKLVSLLLPICLAAQVVTALVIYASVERPYRQPQPLWENDYKLAVGRQESTLVLSQSYAYYLSEAIEIAEQAGFMKGVPMIDLTGQSPGILYALGAKNIGQAWTIGGYLGSDSLAIEMLKTVTCQDLATTWVLAEPEGPRKISPEVLLSFGANLATDFEIIGTFDTAEGAGGYKEIRIQQLLKPVRRIESAMTECAATRTINQ